MVCATFVLKIRTKESSGWVSIAIVSVYLLDTFTGRGVMLVQVRVSPRPC